MVTANLPSLTMQDELGIVYLIDTPQQFWSGVLLHPTSYDRPVL